MTDRRQAESAPRGEIVLYQTDDGRTQRHVTIMNYQLRIGPAKASTIRN
jgi:hypothetical protein